MNLVRTVSALLLALPLMVFGANKFLQMFPLPPGDESAGGDLLQAMYDGGLMSPIALSHVVAAVLLVLPRTRFLGGLLQLPMTLGIVSFHVAMLPAGAPVALVMLVLNLVVIADPPRLRALLVRPAADRATP